MVYSPGAANNSLIDLLTGKPVTYSAPHDDNTYRWATVASAYPLTVRVDGDTQPLAAAPDTLVALGDLKPGDRVWVQFYNRRAIVLGSAGSQFSSGTKTMALMQTLMSGGGVRKVSTTGVSWDQRFIMIGTGASDLIPQGYYNIDMPPDGTVIPVHSSALETVTVASGTVPLSNWQALYYEVPLGQNAASQPGNFHIVFWVGGDDYQVPSDWVLVCLRNADTTAHLYKWGDGRAQDAWKALTLQNSWVPYGGGWATPSWRFLDTGEIELHGLVKNGTSPAACTTFASNLAPVGSSTTGFLFSQASNTGGARVDVHGDGQVVVQSYFGGGSNAFVSLDGMRWFPGDV